MPTTQASPAFPRPRAGSCRAAPPGAGAPAGDRVECRRRADMSKPWPGRPARPGPGEEHWAMAPRLRFAFILCLLLAGLLPGLASPFPAVAATVPSGFSDSLVASIGSPTALAFTSDGRLLVTTQGGQLFIVQGDQLQSPPA